MGADGVNAGDVATGNPLPVTGTVAVSAISSTVGVSGTLTATQGSPAVGSSAWPTSTVEDTTNTIVKPGDAVNKAIRVNVVSGSTGNAAASNTGSAVPAQGDYTGLNVGGTLRGATAVNPTGSVYAQQIDIASVGGTVLTSTVPVSGTVTVTGTVTVSQPTVVSGRATYTAAQTDTAIVTPTSGKLFNIVRLDVMTDNDNTGSSSNGKTTYRIGCGTTNTPTTTGVIASHPGLGNGAYCPKGDGRGVIAQGAVNQPLRITMTDPGGTLDVNYEYYES